MTLKTNEFKKQLEDLGIKYPDNLYARIKLDYPEISPKWGEVDEDEAKLYISLKQDTNEEFTRLKPLRNVGITASKLRRFGIETQNIYGWNVVKKADLSIFQECKKKRNKYFDTIEFNDYLEKKGIGKRSYTRLVGIMKEDPKYKEYQEDMKFKSLWIPKEKAKEFVQLKLDTHPLFKQVKQLALETKKSDVKSNTHRSNVHRIMAQNQITPIKKNGLVFITTKEAKIVREALNPIKKAENK